jgi:hypothetical protein
MNCVDVRVEVSVLHEQYIYIKTVNQVSLRL